MIEDNYKKILLPIAFLTLLAIIYKRRENFMNTSVTNLKMYTHPESHDDTLRNPNQLPGNFFRPSNTFLVPSQNFEDAMDKLPLPDSVKDEFTEWIDKGLLPVTKDQMSCGGCWAFATAATISARISIATNGKWDEPFGLSDQYLISCGGTMGMQQWQGCQGGIPQYAIDSLQNEGLPKDAKDVTLPTKYTYFQTNRDENSSCAISPASTCACSLIQDKITGPRYSTVGDAHTYTVHGPDKQIQGVELWPNISQDIIDENVARMKKAIYYEGPFTVGIKVTEDFYKFVPTTDNYFKYDGKSQDLGGHAVTVLGWKKAKDGTPVWICKNSWGDNWGYGFPQGVTWKNPITEQTEIKYSGGFWNHIMGINDSYIESNAVGGHPNLKDPDIAKFLPNNGEKIPIDWYKTMTIRDIYNHHDAPDVKPDETKKKTDKRFVKDDYIVTVKGIDAIKGAAGTDLIPVSLQDIHDFFDNPVSKYLVAGTDNDFESMMKYLPGKGKPINADTLSDIIDDIQDNITDYVVLGIKGDNGIKYWLIGDTNEWNAFNLQDFAGRTTDPTVATNILYEQIKIIPSGQKVFFVNNKIENFHEFYTMPNNWY